MSHHRDKDGSHFVGLKLRGLEDNTTPLFIESALKRPDSAAMTGNDTKVTDQVIDNDEDYKDDILYNYSIKKKEEEKKGSPSSFLSSLPAIEKEWEAKTPSSPSSSSVTTTYSDAPPSGSVRSVIDPQLPMDGGGACPSCRGRKVKHSVSDSMCMACGHRFETGYRS